MASHGTNRFVAEADRASGNIRRSSFTARRTRSRWGRRTWLRAALMTTAAALFGTTPPAHLAIHAGGRSILERSPLRRLPDRLLQGCLSALAAGVLILIGYFFVNTSGALLYSR